MQAEVIYCRRRHHYRAAAYYLAKEGVSVLVLEGSPHIGNGGSTRNGGGVRQSGRGPTGIAAGDVCDSKSVAEAVRYAGYKRRILSARKFAARQHASP